MKSSGLPARFIRVLLSAPLALTLLITICGIDAVRSQTLSNIDRDRGHVMLSVIKDDIKKNYYDPAFHGMDIEARFKTADQKINQATSNGQVFGIIAQVMIELNDSHTFFIPPQRASRTEYGWQAQMIGDKCFVTAVKPGSNAESKGLKEGDEILSWAGYTPDREHMWVLQYLFYQLRPVAGMRIMLREPAGKEVQLEVMAKVVPGTKVVDVAKEIWQLIRDAESESRLHRHRYYEIGDDLMIWKMPEFDLSEERVDDMFNKARKHKALIIDLRGNPGGEERTLLRMIGNVIDHDVKVGDLKRRKEGKAMIAKTRGGHVFDGKISVLVDANSGSAAELFARVMQLEKRARVIGDRTAGAVMRSLVYDHTTGIDTVVFYAASITDADIVMTDGKSLEHVGVTPDELLLPAPADLAAKRDPVLSRAAALAGVPLEPEKAGAMFPVEWRK